MQRSKKRTQAEEYEIAQGMLVNARLFQIAEM